MRRKKLSRSTSFLAGVCGAGLHLLAAVLLLAGSGAAAYLFLAALAMFGAMLLFLAAGAEGEKAPAERKKLLGLFFLLLASFVPVPVGQLCYALVIPLLLRLYGAPGDGLPLAVLCVCEFVYALADTLGATGFTGGIPAGLLVGVALILVSLARGWVLLRLRARQKGAPSPLRR